MWRLIYRSLYAVYNNLSKNKARVLVLLGAIHVHTHTILPHGDASARCTALCNHDAHVISLQFASWLALPDKLSKHVIGQHELQAIHLGVWTIVDPM